MLSEQLTIQRTTNDTFESLVSFTRSCQYSISVQLSIPDGRGVEGAGAPSARSVRVRFERLGGFYPEDSADLS